MPEVIPIGSDHAGVGLKTRLVEELRSLGYEPLDLGTTGTESVDYPDFAHEVAGRVERREAGRGVLLCGTGLAQIDAVIRQPDRPAGVAPVLRDPAEVVALALEGHDVAARRALARFCAILGGVCGDAALMHGARSVVIAGGIVPRFVPFLRSSAFRERFLAKGRFAAYLENVAIHVVTHPQPGLLGAAVALRARLEASR